MLVKVSAHLEQLKFGRKGESFGISLSYAESRALFAVQKLLDKANYKGNGLPVPYNGMTLPRLNVRIADYLNAYGVTKRETNRGASEFSSEGRRVAMAALHSLGEREFHLEYERREKKEMKTVKSHEGLVTSKVTGRQLVIVPSPILVDQIETYFILKPDDLYEKNDQSSVLFVEYLLYHQSRKTVRKKNPVISEQPETIIAKLRLDHLLRNRKKAEIRSRLNRLYDSAKSSGYLAGYATDQQGTKVAQIDMLYLPVGRAKSTSSTRNIYQLDAQRPSGVLINTGVL
jgi:hypothetical protein